MERAGIGDLLDRQTQRLSGGQVQSVRFAITIAGDPELVFLDEPTAAMDVSARRAFWQMIRQFSREGRTVLFATHHLHEADQIADRVVVVNHGRVVADGPGATLKASVATRWVRFVCEHPDLGQLDGLEGVTDVEIHGKGVTLASLDADATVRALVRQRIAFSDLEVTGAGLEDAFVALTEGDTMSEKRLITPLLAFGRFEVGRLLRSWRFLLITVGFPVSFYLLFLGNQSAGGVVDGTVPWPMYLMVTMCSFGALVAGLTAGGARLSAERASGWARQLRVTPIPAWSYVVTKVAASMFVVLPVIVLVDAVGAAFGGVHLSIGRWLGLTAVMWVSALPFALLGVFLGFMVNAETAFPVVIAPDVRARLFRWPVRPPGGHAGRPADRGARPAQFPQRRPGTCFPGRQRVWVRALAGAGRLCRRVQRGHRGQAPGGGMARPGLAHMGAASARGLRVSERPPGRAASRM